MKHKGPIKGLMIYMIIACILTCRAVYELDAWQQQIIAPAWFLFIFSIGTAAIALLTALVLFLIFYIGPSLVICGVQLIRERWRRRKEQKELERKIGEEITKCMNAEKEQRKH